MQHATPLRMDGQRYRGGVLVVVARHEAPGSRLVNNPVVVTDFLDLLLVELEDLRADGLDHGSIASDGAVKE